MASLGPSLQELTTGVQETMGSVHNFNVAALNTHAMPNGLRQDLSSLRNALKSHWSDIKSILQQCYDVVDQFLVLVQSIGKETDQECFTYLSELLKLISTIENNCHNSMLQNSEISKRFNKAAGGLASLQQLSSSDVVSASEIPPLPTVSAGLSEGADEFMRSNIAAAYPDGTASAKSTSRYLADTQKHLNMILQFWATLRAEFQHTSSRQMSIRTLKDKCNRYREYWTADRENIRVAVSALSRSIDAITVTAVAAPARRHSSNIDSYPSPPALKVRTASQRSMTLPAPASPPFSAQSQSSYSRYSSKPAPSPTTYSSKPWVDSRPLATEPNQELSDSGDVPRSPAHPSSSRSRKRRQTSTDIPSPSRRSSSDTAFARVISPLSTLWKGQSSPPQK